MSTPRQLPLMVTLKNGEVLVAGGFSAGNPGHVSAEIFNPSNGTWRATTSMHYPRAYSTMTLLQDGRVLVVGGGGDLSSASAELYDPSTETWTLTGPLTTPRFYQKAVLLQDGRVLVSGGCVSTYLSSAELFDPSTGNWTATGSMSIPRVLHSMACLQDGRVLVAGGHISGTSYSSAELYNPTSGQWTAAPSMSVTRGSHTMVLLADGRVLVSGGVATGYVFLSQSEIFDPSINQWTVTGSMTARREWHVLTLVEDGRVLATGGRSSISSSIASSEVYNPQTGQWLATASMTSARRVHEGVLLADGRVFIAGGIAGYTTQELASAESYGCRVLLDAGAGTPALSKKMYYMGTDVYGTLQTPTRTGYAFGGWSVGVNGDVTESTRLKTITNHTLYAKWTVRSYTLSLDAEGGVVSPASKSVTYDSAYGELAVPARTGHTFAGWWVGDNGTGTQVTRDTTVTTAADHTIYAKWTEDPYLCPTEGEDALSSQGSYEGFFYNEFAFDGTPSPAVRGTLSLTLSTLSGKLTAKAITQKGSLHFRTSIWTLPNSEGICRAVMMALSGEVLDLYVGQNRIWGTLSGGSLEAECFTLDGMRNRFADTTDVEAQTQLDRFRGYYTVALPIYSALSLGAANAAPEGTGYMTLTVGDRGNVKIAGVLSDGTRFSQSSHLILFAGCGPEACVPVFEPLYSRAGWLGGLLWFDPAKRTVVTDRDLGWFMRWEKTGSGVDGFSELLDACGGFYRTQEALAAHYRFRAETNSVPYFYRGITHIQPAFPTDISVAVDGTHLTIAKGIAPVLSGGVYNYSAAENSSMTTLMFDPDTGIFKGSFKLYYDSILGSSLHHKILSVPYAGVLTPLRSEAFNGLPAGQGYYLVPDTDPAFAPYRLKRSYLIELADAP